jgi:2-polyprenyl-3-methyl-5-hydroxy-6-metoxy-1,4-benzoquinol methylase
LASSHISGDKNMPDLRRLPTVLDVGDIDRVTGRPNEVFDRFLAESVGGCATVLDVGCFIGINTKKIRDIGKDVVGVDVSGEVIAEAARRYPELKFLKADAMELSGKFPPESFDCVVASEVIEHVTDPKRFLAEAGKVLKPGGRLVLTTQNSNGIQYRVRMLLGRFRWDPYHFRMYSRWEIEDEVKAAGFRIIRVKMIPVAVKRRETDIFRLAAYAAARLYPNFAWTTGIVAVKGSI